MDAISTKDFIIFIITAFCDSFGCYPIVYLSDDHVEKKFISLKSSYTRKLRELRDSKKSGCGTEDVRVIKWPFFRALHFLRPVININPKTSSNMVCL